MNNELNLIGVVRTLLKWKKHIIALTILGAISSILVSLYVLKPYYQSFALLYPTNQSMADRSALFSYEGNTTGESSYYGTKHDANRILSMANSTGLLNHIIQKYDIANHYGYTEGTKYRGSKTYEKFMKNYAAYKTDKDAIRINLLDTDKDLAATIVNDIVKILEEQTSRPIKENKQKISATFTEKMKEKGLELKQKADALKKMQGNSIAFRLAQDEYLLLKDEYKEIKNLKEQYDIAAQQEMPGIQVIESAYAAERKIKPIRSRIVVVSTFLSFFFACLFALLAEQIIWLKEQL